MTVSLKDQFLLDPTIHYLNHGSYGACPRPVFDEYQRWQRELERQPNELLGRRITGLMAEARAALAAYLGVDADEVVYFANPTTAINVVARSLRLGAGDEVLATDHEYGALDRTWRFLASRTGFSYLCWRMPLPMTTAEEFVDRFWAGVTPRTRVIFISHITSSTALIFPVEAICVRARTAGILTIVDGAHAPGQMRPRPRATGADFYAGACHKWLCAPKGSGFLYARRDVQPLLSPLVVSWGYESEAPSGSTFVDHHEWQGTRDMSAFLATPAAIRFQAEHDWDQVRSDCHALVQQARERINALAGLPPICPASRGWFVQMAVVRLPLADASLAALRAFQGRLYDELRIEVPVFAWNDQPMLRVSVQAYNSQADIDALVGALGKLLGAAEGRRRPRQTNGQATG